MPLQRPGCGGVHPARGRAREAAACARRARAGRAAPRTADGAQHPTAAAQRAAQPLQI